MFPAASELGDFSLIWHIVNTARGTASNAQADASLLLAALLGVESLVVNQGLKRLFNRQRPTAAGDPRYPVRRPSTSSFPSGHASAAFFAATLLIARDGKRWAPLWLASPASSPPAGPTCASTTRPTSSPGQPSARCSGGARSMLLRKLRH